MRITLINFKYRVLKKKSNAIIFINNYFKSLKLGFINAESKNIYRLFFFFNLKPLLLFLNSTHLDNMKMVWQDSGQVFK